MDSKNRYEQIKSLTADRNLRASQTARDIINNFPPIDSINWERRNKAEGDLKYFLETYFPNTFNLGWSDDHLKVIRKIEGCVGDGGQFCVAMPRGSGKTAILTRALLWCILTGRKNFVCLIGATEKASCKLLQHIKTELSFNPLLLQDFPTACYPFVRLQNITRRAEGQLYNGNPTLLQCTADRIVMPTIDRQDSKSNGSIILTMGITGNIRGAQHVTQSGETLRPDFILLDDPQTRESSASFVQTQNLYDIIQGDVMGLAGHTKAISVFAAVTVIYKDDLSDRLLQLPRWQGERTKLLYSFPTNQKLWDEYRELLNNDQAAATTFYKSNQEEMNKGAIPAWNEAYTDQEVSATQHAMNLFFTLGAEPFYAEYQNDPQFSAGDEIEIISTAKICERVNSLKRGVVPTSAQWVVASIDVMHSLLYYSVIAFDHDFTAAVIDYGTFPDQKRPYFSMREAKLTLQVIQQEGGKDGQVWNGLDKLTSLLLAEGRYKDENGETRLVDRILIDAGDGLLRETIAKFCKESVNHRMLMPSLGKPFGASAKPMSEYKVYKGDRLGYHWRIPAASRGKSKFFNIDIYYWMTYIHEALNKPRGEKGGLTFFGESPSLHRMYADHLISENCILVSTKERSVHEWRIKNNRPDNHLFDTTVACYAAASWCGAQVIVEKKIPKTEQKNQTPTLNRNRVRYINL